MYKRSHFDFTNKSQQPTKFTRKGPIGSNKPPMFFDRGGVSRDPFASPSLNIPSFRQPSLYKGTTGNSILL